MVRGVDARCAEVTAALNEIVDPCSSAAATPVGLADLGLIESVVVNGGTVKVALLTTSPQCMFVGHFAAEAERVVGALPWVEEVAVELRYELMWDETRMTPAGRLALRRPRAEGA